MLPEAGFKDYDQCSCSKEAEIEYHGILVDANVVVPSHRRLLALCCTENR